jgi:hypothetical protein
MRNKDIDDIGNIIDELKAMMLCGSPRSPEDVAKERQRLDQIEAALNAKGAMLPPYMRGIFNTIRGTNKGKRGQQ